MQSGVTLGFRQVQTLSMTAGLRRAIGLLQYGNLELATHLLRELPDNPYVEVRRDGARLSPPLSGMAREEGRAWENLSAAPSGLIGHIANQITLEIRDEAQRRIAWVFLDALEPHGWLGATLSQIAAGADCTIDAAQDVLARLQGFDPPGIFARSLAECLQLQARDRGVLDDCLGVVLDNLLLLAEGRIADLAGIAGCPEERITEAARLLRTFDPKPGAVFGLEDGPVRPPDLVLSRGPRGLTIELNATTLPEIVIRDDLVQDAQQRGLFIAEALASARGMKRAIEMRNANTLAVASEMVRRQTRFIEDAEAALVPLTMQDVARAVTLHESTVSRITNGLTLQTPRGVIGLRGLLCRGIKGRDRAVSVQSVQARIGALIAAEPRDAPLSDAQITTRLKAEGVEIQRRTVAKYRGVLGIPGSTRRHGTRGGAAP